MSVDGGVGRSGGMFQVVILGGWGGSWVGLLWLSVGVLMMTRALTSQYDVMKIWGRLRVVGTHVHHSSMIEEVMLG